VPCLSIITSNNVSFPAVALPQGVIPAKPDAWVWLGDFAYMDDPLINCDLVPSYPECNCTADFMRRPPFGCFAGVAEHARLRVQLQVNSAWDPGSCCALHGAATVLGITGHACMHANGHEVPHPAYSV
jgi:hypothetical protein